jgi:hypothetical protein
MIRPEARALLLRHRETLAGLAALGLGFWWLFGPGRLLTFPALALLCAGAALVWVGLQRARFRTQGAGQGVVQVTEGQVVYLGPVTGGAVSLRELSQLSLDGRQTPARWRLVQPDQRPLEIPVDAEGADALFDAFAALPGLRTGRLLSVLRVAAPRETVIWRRDRALPAQLCLH